MVANCAAFNCTHRGTKDENGRKLTYHRFPLSNESLCRQWVRAIHRKNFKPTAHLRICSAHFEERCYLSGYINRRQLKDDAVPTLFDFPDHLKKKMMESDGSSDVMDSDGSSVEEASDTVDSNCQTEALPSTPTVTTSCDEEQLECLELNQNHSKVPNEDDEEPFLEGKDGRNLFAKTCRLCGCDTKKSFLLIADREGPNQKLITKLYKYLPLLILPNDGFPLKVCSTCLRNLSGVAAFIEDCITAQYFLKCIASAPIGVRDKIKDDYEKTKLTRSCVLFAKRDDIKQDEVTDMTEWQDDHKRESGTDRPLRVVLGPSDGTDVKEECSESNSSRDEDNRSRSSDRHDRERESSIGKHLDNLVSTYIDNEEIEDNLVSTCIDNEEIEDNLVSTCIDNEEIEDNLVSTCIDNEEIEDNLVSTYIDSEEIECKKVTRAEKRFYCSECCTPFLSEIGLEGHTCIPELKDYSCEICHKILSGKRSYYSHIRSHSVENQYVCRQCNVSLKTALALQLHVMSHDKKRSKTDFVCKICGWVCRRGEQFFMDHQNKHSGKKSHICDKCGQTFKSLICLKKHDSVHSNLQPFVCDICGKTFAHRSSFYQHRRIHLDKSQVSFQCHSCGESFRTKRMLVVHSAVHTGGKDVSSSRPSLENDLPCHTELKQYKCEFCKKRFATSLSFKMHQSLHVKVDDDLKCKICEKQFASSVGLKDHASIHSGEKPFECSHCEKTFRLKGLLTLHSRCHSSERSFICKYCNKAYRHRNNLCKHELIHTGVRNYSCAVCEKTFRRKSSADIHMRIHTGEKPYKCSVCDQRFTQKNDCVKHVRRHETKEGTVVVIK